MARTSYNFSFDMRCEIKFETAIREHHVYTAVWTPRQGEWLVCKKGNGQEALKHDILQLGFTKNVLRIAARLWLDTYR